MQTKFMQDKTKNQFSQKWTQMSKTHNFSTVPNPFHILVIVTASTLIITDKTINEFHYKSKMQILPWTMVHLPKTILPLPFEFRFYAVFRNQFPF